MKKRVNYLWLITLVLLMINWGCEEDFPIPGHPDKSVNFSSYKSSFPPNTPDVTPDSLGSAGELGTRLTDVPGGERYYGTSFVIGNKLYMGFGWNSSGLPARDLWAWEPEVSGPIPETVQTGTWTKLPDFPGSTSSTGYTYGNPMAFAVNGKGYILPGAFLKNGKLINELWEFDPENSQWTRRADPPATLARYSSAGFSIGTKLYIGTGESFHDLKLGVNGNIYEDHKWTLYNDFWEWDQETDTWTEKAGFPGEVRAHAAGFSIGDKGYLGLGGVVGMGGGPVYHDFWEYNPSSDSWQRKADFIGLQVIDPLCFTSGTSGFIMAAWDPIIDSTADQEIWEWNQQTKSWTLLGAFAGTVRTGAVGGALGNRGYISSGSNSSKNWESEPILKDFWVIELPLNSTPPL